MDFEKSPPSVTNPNGDFSTSTLLSYATEYEGSPFTIETLRFNLPSGELTCTSFAQRQQVYTNKLAQNSTLLIYSII